jgi:hypothetical protein
LSDSRRSSRSRCAASNRSHNAINLCKRACVRGKIIGTGASPTLPIVRLTFAVPLIFSTSSGSLYAHRYCIERTRDVEQRELQHTGCFQARTFPPGNAYA